MPPYIYVFNRKYTHTKFKVGRHLTYSQVFEKEIEFQNEHTHTNT